MKVFQLQLLYLHALKVEDPSCPRYCKTEPNLGQLYSAGINKMGKDPNLFLRMENHPNGKNIQSPTGIATSDLQETARK